jgi:hypothetical protein
MLSMQHLPESVRRHARERIVDLEVKRLELRQAGQRGAGSRRAGPPASRAPRDDAR